MEIIIFFIPWVLIGIGIIFVSFSGGPGAARAAYLTRGNRTFRVVIPLLYIATGIAVPAAVIASRDEATGATDQLASETPSGELERGKLLFRQTCASCHDLDALNARGVTGPDLDEIGQMTVQRVRCAVENGGTGQNRMPAELLAGDNAVAVARYVTEVAGGGGGEPPSEEGAEEPCPEPQAAGAGDAEAPAEGEAGSGEESGAPGADEEPAGESSPADDAAS
jgi:mono/diheme cytochrome c family protein